MTAINSERSFNEALARVLWSKHPAWQDRVTAEQHRAVKGGGQPDLIVRIPLGAPVVVETEYLPASRPSRPTPCAKPQSTGTLRRVPNLNRSPQGGSCQLRGPSDLALRGCDARTGARDSRWRTCDATPAGMTVLWMRGFL